MTRDLIDHANQILSLVHDGLTQEIIQLAQERGLIWAKSDVPIMTKMEWFYALRKVIWSFLRQYHLQAGWMKSTKRGIQKIYIDLSAAVILSKEIFQLLLQIIDDVSLLGCKAVVTGISSKLAKIILSMSGSITDKVAIESTLQQALAKESANMNLTQ